MINVFGAHRSFHGIVVYLKPYMIVFLKKGRPWPISLIFAQDSIDFT